jgi:hypothetical protein
MAAAGRFCCISRNHPKDMPRLIACARALLLLLTLSGFAPARNWNATTIEPGKVYETSPRSLALDSAGNPHAAFGSSQLHYAFRDAGGWHVEVVDATPGVAADTSLALDAGNKAHIAYYDKVNNRLLYATNVSGSWVKQVVAPGGGSQCTIVVDSAGKAHIVDSAGRYSTNLSGSWVTENITPAPALNALLAIDSQDRLIVCYFQGDGVWEARRAGGAWNSEKIFLAADFNPARTSSFGLTLYDIAVDSTDHLHMVLQNSYDHPTIDGSILFLASNAAGTWVSSPVSSTALHSFGASIAVDSQNKPHVSFSLPEGSTTGVAYLPPGGESQKLDGSTGGTSISLGSADSVHILSNQLSTGIEYYRRTTGQFTNEVVSAPATRGEDTSIQRDPAGALHISHVTDQGLVYSSNKSGSWQSVVVDAEAPRLKGPTFLGLDASGRAHIGYTALPAATFGFVGRYATNASGSWAVETIDPARLSTGDGVVHGLQVDSTGKVHVQYQVRTVETTEIRYAVRTNGMWAIQTAAGGDTSIFPGGLAVDASGRAHLTFSKSVSFLSRAFYSSNLSGSFVEEDTGVFTSPRAIVLDANAQPHIIGASGRLVEVFKMNNAWQSTVAYDGSTTGRTRAAIDGANNIHVSFAQSVSATGSTRLLSSSKVGGKWSTVLVDTGAGGAREFSFASVQVSEAAGTALIGVSPTGQARVGEGAAIALAPNGDLHISYSDGTTGGLKLATFSNAAITAVNTVDFATAGGTAIPDLDFTNVSGMLGWALGDTSTKFIEVPILQDGAFEGNETFSLELSNPGNGTVLGTLSNAVASISDDDSPPLPPGAIVSFLLPKKVEAKQNDKDPEKSSLKVTGIIDLGWAPPNLGGPATLEFGNLLTVSIPGLEQVKDTKYEYKADGLELQILTSRKGSSKGKFKLKFTGAFANALSPDSFYTIRFNAGTVDGICQCKLTKGKFTLRKKAGELVKPTIYPFSARATLAGEGKDKLTFMAGLGAPGAIPEDAPAVHIEFGPNFVFDIDPADLQRKGNTYRYKGPSGGITSLVLDYGKEVVFLTGKGMTLGSFGDGPVPIAATLRIGASTRAVVLRMHHEGKTLKY